MRTPLVLCSIVMLAARIACASDDAYSLSFIKALLQLPPGVSISVAQKQIHRLGDKTAIALIKVLEQKDFHDPQKVRRLLPIIRDSFAFPELISLEEDRKPKVTFLLLSYIREHTSDPQAKQEALETIAFIKAKTIGN